MIPPKEFIKKIRPFSFLSEDETNILISGLEVKLFQKNKLIFKKGDDRKYVYIIFSGLVGLFDDEIAVDYISKGEIFGFLGANGAGKTTTMKAITTFLNPTEGNISVGNYSIYDNPDEVRRLIGYLPENNRERLTLPGLLQGPADEVAEFVGVDRLAEVLGGAHAGIAVMTQEREPAVFRHGFQFFQSSGRPVDQNHPGRTVGGILFAAKVQGHCCARSTSAQTEHLTAGAAEISFPEKGVQA